MYVNTVKKDIFLFISMEPTLCLCHFCQIQETAQEHLAVDRPVSLHLPYHATTMTCVETDDLLGDSHKKQPGTDKVE